jgi:predicted RNA-binding Zn-ribbon protein involved in translation (DUF1610 family)
MAVGYVTADTGAEWKPGDGHREALALCCPCCGSVQVAKRDSGRDPTTRRYKCDRCWHYHTRPADLALVKGWTFNDPGGA